MKTIRMASPHTGPYVSEMTDLEENIKAIEDAVNIRFGDCRKATLGQVGRLKAANDLLRQAAAVLVGQKTY